MDNDYKLELNCRDENKRVRPYLADNGKIFYAMPVKNRIFAAVRKFANQHSEFLYFVLSRLDMFMKKYNPKKGISAAEEEIAFKHSCMITNRLMKMARDRYPGVKMLIFCSDNDVRAYEEFKKISRFNSMDFIDGVPQALMALKKKGAMLTVDGAHWNESGHRIVAKKIIEYLKSDNLLN